MIIFMIIIAIIIHYMDHHKSFHIKRFHIFGSYGIRIVSHTFKGYHLVPHYLAFTSGTWVFVILATVLLLR